MENLLAQITIDFGKLAEDHYAAARNEHLWALGARDNETAVMHEENSDDHRQLALLYKNISNNPKWLLEKLLAFGDQT